MQLSSVPCWVGVSLDCHFFCHVALHFQAEEGGFLCYHTTNPWHKSFHQDTCGLMGNNACELRRNTGYIYPTTKVKVTISICIDHVNLYPFCWYSSIQDLVGRFTPWSSGWITCTLITWSLLNHENQIEIILSMRLQVLRHVAHHKAGASEGRRSTALPTWCTATMHTSQPTFLIMSISFNSVRISFATSP